MRKEIFDLHSDRPKPQRFCDVIVENGTVRLEVKKDRGLYQSILWDDVVYQVEAAIQIASTI